MWPFVSLMSQNVFEFHPYCCTCQSIPHSSLGPKNIPLYDAPRFADPFFSSWTLGLVSPFRDFHGAATNIRGRCLV